MKFLFVDDDGDFLKALKGAFTNNPNVAFAECHGVGDALREIAEQHPDLIFLDHHLTDRGNEGFEIADRVIGVKIYSTSTRKDLALEYEKRGIKMVEKTDLKMYRSIIENYTREGKMVTEISQEEKLRKLIGDEKVSDEARTFIAGLEASVLKVATPNVFVWLTHRSMSVPGAGIAYYVQVHLYYFGQTRMVEYRWRHHWDPQLDEPKNAFRGFGMVGVTEADGVATVSVELVSNEGNRTETYPFKQCKT